MGRGDNRKGPKVRQRKAWRRKKSRIRSKMEAAMSVGGAKAPAKKKTSSSSVVRKASAPTA